MKSYIIYIGALIFLLNSCSNQDLLDNTDHSLISKNDNIEHSENTLNKEEYLSNFANILSKAVYENKDVREFLKVESLKQFDKNYDILYYLVKDEYIGNKTFREILISYSSLEIIENIEKNIPLLNIYVSKIAFFNIFPEELDVEDNEIPVAVSLKKETALFFNGNKELSLEKGDIPNFHVFVVNENSRVIIPDSSSNKLKSSGKKEVLFKSPNFDGTFKEEEASTLKSTTANFSVVGQKAIDSFKYFYKDDGSINQKGQQRDYVYYGITPQNQIGSLNRSVSEYISYIEIYPNTYFRIIDKNEVEAKREDPYITTNTVVQKSKRLTEAELLDRMWTKGAYDFKFEIVTSKGTQFTVVYIPLRPEQIWDFNITNTRVEPKWYRHSKNTYKINPNNFTSKKVFLDKMVSLGKWNIAEESLERYINIYEEGGEEDVEVKETYDLKIANKNNFKGDSKINLGLNEIKIELGGSASSESSRENNVKIEINTKRKIGSDYLGSSKIYFYDPLIESISSNNTCQMHTYNTSYLEFGITVK